MICKCHHKWFYRDDIYQTGRIHWSFRQFQQGYPTFCISVSIAIITVRVSLQPVPLLLAIIQQGGDQEEREPDLP